MNFFIISSIWLCLAPLFFLTAACSYTSISTRHHQVVFHYPDQSHSEKSLPICGETSVCSVLYKRYWLPTIADRLCRCTNNDECPWKWSNIPDNRTMILNNRSQLKFCSSIAQLQTCSRKKTALVIQKMSLKNETTFYNIKSICYCSSEHYWKYYKTSKHIFNHNDSISTTLQNEFKCVPLKLCDTNEFCGNARADYNSIYYTCSCPIGHLCVYKDQHTKTVEELLYKGPAYRAICEPQDPEDYEYSI